MPNLDPLPSPFESGKTISAKALNQIAQSAIRMISGVDDIDVRYYGDRVTIGRKDIGSVLPGSGNYLQQFVILQELDDVLVCTPYIQPSNGVGEGSAQVPQPFQYFAYANETNLVLVAKPYYLQKSPWHQRVVSQSGQNYFITYTSIGVRTLNSVTLYSASTTFTQPNPPGDEAVTLLAIGGSGGGYGASTIIPTPGRGAESILNYTLTNAHIYQITIGAGGAPGVAGSNSYVFDTTTGGPPAITGTGGDAGDPSIASTGSQGQVGIVHYSTDIVQKITPAYLVGEVIVATRAVTGYYSTGLDKLGNPLPVLFIDANEAGRTWFAPSKFSGVQLLKTGDTPIGLFPFDFAHVTWDTTHVGLSNGINDGYWSPSQSNLSLITTPTDGIYAVGVTLSGVTQGSPVANSFITAYLTNAGIGNFPTLAGRCDLADRVYVPPTAGIATTSFWSISLSGIGFSRAGDQIYFAVQNSSDVAQVCNGSLTGQFATSVYMYKVG